MLPGVTVVATQEGTGVASTTVTNERGEFIFPGLRVGVYTVTAELQGFKRALRRDIAVNVQTRAQVDVQLNVGALAEEVIVTGRSELLQTQTPTSARTSSSGQVRDLPLLGRRYSELALLAPGVVAAPAGITSRGEDTFFNANGNFATWNNYTLDGADNNSILHQSAGTQPAGRAAAGRCAQEFKVQTRTYSAEFGKAAGAVINASVKQGTNQFRGTLFGFFRDESFNANTWDNNRASVRRARSTSNRRRHARRTARAGPTFFFGDYQAPRTERALSQTATVPTARMRRAISRADRSDDRHQPVRAGRMRGRGQQDHQPGLLRSGRAKLIGLFPLPNVPGSPGILQQQLPLERHPELRRQPVRRPHRSQTCTAGSDHLFARYSFQNTNRHEPPLLDDPVAVRRFCQRHPESGPERRRRVVAPSSAIECLQRAARLVQHRSART